MKKQTLTQIHNLNSHRMKKQTLTQIHNLNSHIMKKFILTLSVLFFTLLSFSQGIAIQGIARDDNNTARTNVNVALTFEIYFKDDNNLNEIIYTETPTLQTDAFGVFSHVLNLPNETESQLSNQDTYLKISDGATTISDELFKRVPLAYSASNGVPTGSIMPYVGETAPTGWLLCDGAYIPVNNYTAALRTLLGPTTPNLKGMFLRGTGKSLVNNRYGPALNETQDEGFKSHSHESGTLELQNEGAHQHRTRLNVDNIGGDGGGLQAFNRLSTASEIGSAYVPTDKSSLAYAGNHDHGGLKGSTAHRGDPETRPVNYGVNYIIKL